MGGLLRYTNAIVGMGLVGIGIAMIASPELVVPEMYGKKKNGQRVKGEPSTAWVAIGCFEVFMGTVLCMSFYWGKEARFWLGLVYLLLMCALMYDLSENAPKSGLAPFGFNNFTYNALIFTSCWYVVALVMNRLEPGYLTADKKTKYAVEGEKSSLLGATKDKAKAAAALDEERVEVVTYGASEETEPIAGMETKEPVERASREVVNVSEAAPGPAADVAREAEAEVVHRRWERHPKGEADGESSDGGDIAIDYGASTDEEDAANEKKRKKKEKKGKGKETEGAADATKADARAETEATEATKAGGKEREKREEPARAEEAPAAPPAPAAAAEPEPPKPSAKERALLLDPQEEVRRILASRADAYAVLDLDAATVTDAWVADQREVLELCVAQCGDDDSREEAMDVLRAAHDALCSAWQRGLYGMFGYSGATPKPKDAPEEGEAVAPEEGAAKDLEEGGDEFEGLSEEAKERKKKLAAALAKVEARKQRAKERGEDEEFTYDDKRSTHGTVARLVSPTMSPKASSQAIAEEAEAAAKAEEEAAAAAAAKAEEEAAAAAAKAEEEAAAAAKAEEEAAAAAKAEEEAAAAAAKAEEEAAAAKAEEEEAAAAAAALAATALAAAAAKAEEEEAAAKAKAEEEAAAAAAAKAKAKAEEEDAAAAAAAAAAAQAEEEEVFASPSTSEPVDDSDDEDPIAAAAFGSPAVEQSQSPERSEEDKLLDAAISSIRNLLTARHGAAYTPEQYDAWARHIGLSTGGADYENPPLGHPLFGGVDIMLKSPVGAPGRVKSLAQVVQARIDAERARDGEAKKSELLEMLDDMLDGASIATSPSRSEIGAITPEKTRRRRAAALKAEEAAAEAEAKKAEDDSGGDTVTPTSKFAALVNAARTQQRVSPQPPPPPQFAGYGPYSPLPNVPSYDQYGPYGAPPGYYPQPQQQQQFPGAYGGYPMYASGAQQRTPPQLQPLSPSVDAWLEDESSGEDAGARRSSGGDEREATRASSGKKKPPSSSGGATMRRESPRAMEAAMMRRESPRATEVPPPSYFGYAPSPPVYPRGPPGVVPGAVGLPSPGGGGGGVDDPRRLVILRDQRKGGAVILRERDEVWLDHVVDDVFIMVRRFDPSGPPEGRKFKIKARDADVYSSQDWDTASDDGSMSTRSQETDATARL